MGATPRSEDHLLFRLEKGQPACALTAPLPTLVHQCHPEQTNSLLPAFPPAYCSPCMDSLHYNITKDFDENVKSLILCGSQPQVRVDAKNSIVPFYFEGSIIRCGGKICLVPDVKARREEGGRERGGEGGCSACNI